MAQRSCILPLEDLARTQTVKMTINAFENMLQLEQLDDMYNKEWNTKCKRKRSYSCGDDEPEKPPINKKCRVVETRSESADRVKGTKRSIENVSADATNKNKCQRLGESSSQTNSYCNLSEQLVWPEHKTQDDTTISYCTAHSVTLNILKLYFIRLSPVMWNEYGKSLIYEILGKTRLENFDGIYLKKAVEYIFCEKLSHFSSNGVEDIPSELVGIIYEKLSHCSKMTYLDLSLSPRNDTDVVNMLMTIQRLKHLQALSLLPPTRYSFHWAVQHVAQHCQKLCELRIVYNGDLFNDGIGMKHLQNCTNLAVLWLFNYGRKSETKCLSELLRSLNKMKVLFHKELPNAILGLHESRTVVEDGETTHGGQEQKDINGDTGKLCRITNNQQESCRKLALEETYPPTHFSCQLQLERVDLCWYQEGVGYQLVYVPSSYLLCVAKTCPQIKLLNLVDPSCLAQVMTNLPCLQTIMLQQVSLNSCLRCALQDGNMDRITELHLTDVWDVTYDLISAVANQCSNLQVLKIISSSLEGQGHLTLSPNRPAAFPCLREATLMPTMLGGRPSLTTPTVWQLGAALTAFLLKGSTHLTSLRLVYRKDGIAPEDMPSEQDLEAAICWPPRPTLRHLFLECPPQFTPKLVHAIVEACPALSLMGHLTTWPLTTSQRAQLIAQYKSLDIIH